jgi:hypothetical protein
MSLHLTLSVDSGRGGLQDRATIRHLENLTLVAEFENRGNAPLSVVIDATPLSHGRYRLEFTDDREQPVHPESFGKCGTMSPLQEREIALVEAGSAFRTPVHGERGTFGPGSYRARVQYEAYESDHARESLAPAVVMRLKHLWTGTLISNWISFILLKPGTNPRK